MESQDLWGASLCWADEDFPEFGHINTSTTESRAAGHGVREPVPVHRLTAELWTAAAIQATDAMPAALTTQDIMDHSGSVGFDSSWAACEAPRLATSATTSPSPRQRSEQSQHASSLVIGAQIVEDARAESVGTSAAASAVAAKTVAQDVTDSHPESARPADAAAAAGPGGAEAAGDAPALRLLTGNDPVRIAVEAEVVSDSCSEPPQCVRGYTRIEPNHTPGACFAQVGPGPPPELHGLIPAAKSWECWDGSPVLDSHLPGAQAPAEGSLHDPARGPLLRSRPRPVVEASARQPWHGTVHARLPDPRPEPAQLAAVARPRQVQGQVSVVGAARAEQPEPADPTAALRDGPASTPETQAYSVETQLYLHDPQRPASQEATLPYDGVLPWEACRGSALPTMPQPAPRAACLDEDSVLTIGYEHLLHPGAGRSQLGFSTDSVQTLAYEAAPAEGAPAEAGSRQLVTASSDDYETLPYEACPQTQPFQRQGPAPPPL
mmetsp:Transcript_67049/g.162085  ORF Transcript_67049/g.162085 Transcript_67049/m.162085 type:complete len:494 (+) Transcript_67049:44-1525(+)